VQSRQQANPQTAFLPLALATFIKVERAAPVVILAVVILLALAVEARGQMVKAETAAMVLTAVAEVLTVVGMGNYKL
jgi:hypothetical protein